MQNSTMQFTRNLRDKFTQILFLYLQIRSITARKLSDKPPPPHRTRQFCLIVCARVLKNVSSCDSSSGNFKHRKTTTCSKTKWYNKFVNAPMTAFTSYRSCTRCCIVVELPNPIGRTHSTNIIPVIRVLRTSALVHTS